MSVRATFTADATSVRTKALYQWDYGQQLEIEATDLPAIIEVHFSCAGMTEAIVTTCSVADGLGVVNIPNSCLEQSSQITAWVYEISGTQGCTTKMIAIPITARVRPGRTDEIPQEISDKYTQLIEQVNDALGTLADGTVITKRAEKADNADYATSAGNASSAAYAQSAGNAAQADKANNALGSDVAQKAILLTPRTVWIENEEGEEGEVVEPAAPYVFTTPGKYLVKVGITDITGDGYIGYKGVDLWIVDLEETATASVEGGDTTFTITYNASTKTLSVETDNDSSDYGCKMLRIAQLISLEGW
jgi:hypothetical protein